MARGHGSSSTSGPLRRRRGPVALALVASLLVGPALAGCGSDEPRPATAAEVGRRRLEQRNRSYLLKIGWERDQAACVAAKVREDLSVLLDGSHDDDPTAKDGFTAFAKAAQSCIRASDDVPTTTR